MCQTQSCSFLTRPEDLSSEERKRTAWRTEGFGSWRTLQDASAAGALFPRMVSGWHLVLRSRTLAGGADFFEGRSHWRGL